MSLFLIVALPFLGALLPGLMNAAGRQAVGGVTFTVTLTAFVGLLTNLPSVLAGEVVQTGFNWFPQLGLNVTLMLDGLGFFFATLILGIGLLVICYGALLSGARGQYGGILHLSAALPRCDGRDCPIR